MLMLVCSTARILGGGTRTTQRGGMGDVERRIGWLQNDEKETKKKKRTEKITQ